MAAQRGPLSLTQAKLLGEKLNASLIGGRALGSTLDAGKALARNCLDKAGIIVPEESESQPTDHELRSRVWQILLATS